MQGLPDQQLVVAVSGEHFHAEYSGIGVYDLQGLFPNGACRAEKSNALFG
jgi:hypothetical protein